MNNFHKMEFIFLKISTDSDYKIADKRQILKVNKDLSEASIKQEDKSLVGLKECRIRRMLSVRKQNKITEVMNLIKF